MEDIINMDGKFFFFILRISIYLSIAYGTQKTKLRNINVFFKTNLLEPLISFNVHLHFTKGILSCKNYRI
jgi:hypothetical protein